MRRLSTYRLASLVSMTGLLLGLALPVRAQTNEAVGLSINPAIIEQPLTPGISTTLSIQVTNISDQPLPIAVGTRPLVPLDPLVDEGLRQRYDASQWLTPLQSNLLLEADETASVQLVARPDDNAGVGGHYALVVFRVLAEAAATEASNAQINPEVTSIIMFSLPGDSVESAELTLQQPPIWQFNRPDDASFNLINRGNVHFLPQNQIVFRPLLGGQTQSAEPGPHLVLPGTDSAFSVNWPQLEWGLYKMEIKTSYGTPLKTLETTSRWFFVPPPLWIQVVALICLVAAGRFLVRILRQHPFWRRSRKLAQDDKRLDRPTVKEDLDYLSNQPEVKDISRKRPSKRR